MQKMCFTEIAHRARSKTYDAIISYKINTFVEDISKLDFQILLFCCWNCVAMLFAENIHAVQLQWLHFSEQWFTVFNTTS